MSEIIRHSKLDYEKIEYSKPIQQNNWYFGSIQYNQNPCYIQSSRLTFKEIQEDTSTKQKYLIATVKSNDFSFYDTLVTLDDKNVSNAYQSSKEWFQKEIPIDILDTMYRRISQPFQKGDIPTIKLKLPCYNQSVNCKIYDNQNNSIHIDKLTPGCTLLCIIQLKGLKFLKKEYYCDTHITQIKLVEPSPYVNNETCLIEDDEETIYEHEVIDEQVLFNTQEKNRLDSELSKLTESLESIQKQITQLKQERERLD